MVRYGRYARGRGDFLAELGLMGQSGAEQSWGYVGWVGWLVDGRQSINQSVNQSHSREQRGLQYEKVHIRIIEFCTPA